MYKARIAFEQLCWTWLLSTDSFELSSDTLAEGVDLANLLQDRSENHQLQFFQDAKKRTKILASLSAINKRAAEFNIIEADKICDHIFDLLGSGPTHLGETIDWHVDFKTGHRFDPRQYYANARPAPYPGGYDIKVPWELSRCQHFAWLGQAYWFTEDAKYAAEFVAQVEDWLAANPWPWGVNWTCTMDVAIRAVNWLWGYHFFAESPAMSDKFRLDFYKSMLLHGRHIWRNLENQGDFTGNHYLSNLVGLVYLGILCPVFKEAEQWRTFGLQGLEREMFKQVYADGVNFEASTSYHRLVLEMFLSATILAQINDYRFSTAYMERLEKMVEFVMYLTKPDGTSPLIGDNDNGRLHRLKVWNPPEREWVDFRYLLAIGAVLFLRLDFAQAAGDQWEEAIWLLGESALTFKQQLDAKQSSPLVLSSKAFPDAGLYILRYGDHHLVVDAGPNGQNGNGGHAHNDVLSFELYACGQTWFCDAGTFVYTADYDARNSFRSTSYHNTIKVDHAEQLPFAKHVLWSLKTDTSPQVTCWAITDTDLRFEAVHNAYARLEDPVIHQRRISFDIAKSTWQIDDLLTCDGRHSFELYLHCMPEVVVRHVDSMQIHLGAPDARCELFLHFELCAGQVSFHELDIQEDWVSPGYGIRHTAPVICLKWQALGTTHWRTIIHVKSTGAQ
jgi:uncharacterized heparinase superfamily protein